MKKKFIEWFTKNNNGCSPAMEDDRSFVHEKTQHMFEAYQAGVAEGEARCAALAAENAGLKQSKPSLKTMMSALDAFYADEDVPESAMLAAYNILRGAVETPTTDAFLAEVRAQCVEEFLRGSQLPYQIATALADYDNVDDATLQTVIWSGQPPEPDGDVWHLEYVSRGNTIVRAILKELREGDAQ